MTKLSGGGIWRRLMIGCYADFLSRFQVMDENSHQWTGAHGFLSMNHQVLLWNLHCAATVVLREDLNFKNAVIRSKRSSCFFFVSDVTRPKLPLGQTLHHATYDVYLPKAVETLVHRQCFWTLFSLLCVKYIFVWFKKGIIAISHTEWRTLDCFTIDWIYFYCLNQAFSYRK